MSVKYSWNRQNGAAMPSVRFMSIEPAEDYYKGMPLKLKEKGIVEPTDGDPEYICMAEYNPDAEIQPLEIPVQEVFPDVVYDRMNEDGTIEEVRFGSKGGGGDLLETVEGVVELAFDGTLEGKEYKEISQEGLTFYIVKMSDDTPVSNDLVSVIADDGEGEYSYEISLEDIYDMGNGYSVREHIFCVTENNIEIPVGVSLSKGLWFSIADLSSIGMGLIGGLGLTYNSTKTQLRPSLLPPHKHKWDDLEDAICYDRSKSEPLNLVFDGNLDNYENFGVENIYYVKMSDVVLSLDQIIGSTVIFDGGAGEETLVITSDHVIEMMPNAYIVENALISTSVEISDGDMTITPGIWFSYIPDTLIVKSFSNPNVMIVTGEIKKIDNKFIDAEWMATSSADRVVLPETTYTFGSATGNRYESRLDPQFVIGKDYVVVWNGEKYTCKCKNHPMGAAAGLTIPYLGNASFNNSTGDEYNTGEPFFIVYGMYGDFTVEDENWNTTATFSITEIGYGALPPKFMPELTQVILISPGGKKFKTTVGDDGVLTTTEVTP